MNLSLYLLKQAISHFNCCANDDKRNLVSNDI